MKGVGGIRVAATQRLEFVAKNFQFADFRELAHKGGVCKAHSLDTRKSQEAMKSVWQRSRPLAITAVAMLAVGAAAAVVRPRVVSEPFLGHEWQCSRTAFLVTTCSQSNEKTK
jgi:hypothetical protein